MDKRRKVKKKIKETKDKKKRKEKEQAYRKEQITTEMSDIDIIDDVEEVKFKLVGIEPSELTNEEFTKYMLQSIPRWEILCTNRVFDSDTIFNETNLNDQTFRKK